MSAIVDRLRRPVLTTDYGRDLRLFPSRASKVALLALFLTGALVSRFTARGALYSGCRQLLLGALAAAATYGIGSLVGTAV